MSSIAYEPYDKTKAHFNLTVFNGDKERDEGIYKCIISDNFNIENSQKATIKFVDEEPTQPIIIPSWCYILLLATVAANSSLYINYLFNESNFKTE